MSAINRRGFIRSIFGLGTLIPHTTESVEARAQYSYFWCDLKTGHVGFPSGLYVPSTPPGSIAKIVASACLIDQLHFSENQTYECVGTHRVGKQIVHCQVAHGKLNLVEALGLSCNVFFAQASHLISQMVFLEKAREFGLARPCAGRHAGAFPLAVEGGSSLYYVLGLAPELEPTMLQLMRLAALVAVKPKENIPVLYSAENSDLVAKESACVSPLTEKSRRLIVRGMRLACQKGTARKLDPEDKLHLAVKTGTISHGNKFQSCVMGFFPEEKPRHAFALFSASGTSQDSAIPHLREFLFSTTWPE